MKNWFPDFVSSSAMARTKSDALAAMSPNSKSRPKAKAKAKDKAAAKPSPKMRITRKRKEPPDSDPTDPLELAEPDPLQSSIAVFCRPRQAAPVEPPAPVEPSASASASKPQPDDEEVDGLTSHAEPVKADGQLTQSHGLARLQSYVKGGSIKPTDIDLNDVASACKEHSLAQPDKWQDDVRAALDDFDDDAHENLIFQAKGHQLQDQYVEHLKTEKLIDDDYTFMDEAGDTYEDLVDFINWLATHAPASSGVSVTWFVLRIIGVISS